jgi:LacI family transcriptional regulator
MTAIKPKAAAPASVTIKDVAREAGVSVASVSRVMNGHDNVQAETRARILDVVERLRYAPHLGARELITKRTQVIGVLLPDLHGEFFSELIRGIDGAARERKLHLLLSSCHGGDAEMVEAIRAMRGRVEGLLIMAPHLDTSHLRERLPASVPMVFMNSRVPSGSPELSIDSYRGARAVVRHLAKRGHPQIAHIAGPSDNFDSHERLRGYRDQLASSLPDARALVLTGDFGEASGYAAGRALAAASARPAAVFAANDMMAIGCLAALTEAGLDVPTDIAIAGFDDIPLAAFVRPALTTVRANIAELGRRALQRLAASTDGVAAEPEATAPPLQQLLRPELIVRESCGAPDQTRTMPPHRRAARHGGPEDEDSTEPPIAGIASPLRTSPRPRPRS